MKGTLGQDLIINFDVGRLIPGTLRFNHVGWTRRFVPVVSRNTLTSFANGDFWSSSKLMIQPTILCRDALSLESHECGRSDGVDMLR